MKVSAITLGCKVNQYETQAMLKQLKHAGFTLCDGAADVVLINSCTVTAQSDHKVRQTLHRARRENPTAILVLTGCMPQAFPEQAASLSDADIVLGNSNRASLAQHILNYLSTHQRIVDIEPHGQKFEEMQVTDFYERTRAFVKIEDGCNRFCSYCIIPYARGRVRSKPLADLRAELETLGQHGYKEVVLTGINLPAYGQDLGLTLCDAVEAACAVPGIQRVRLGSLEPEQLSPEVIERLAAQKKLCPQFHLSLQSGCTETLKRMNRHYTADEYRTIIHNLRATFDNAAMTTDIMVGFAGETEEEFQASLRFAKEIAFAKVHVFAYSRRPGTRAADFPGQMTNAEKERRSHLMTAAAEETRQAFLKDQIGKVEPVLFEQRREAGVFEGYTPNYTPVLTATGDDLSGQILSVKITDVIGDCCKGILCSE